MSALGNWSTGGLLPVTVKPVVTSVFVTVTVPASVTKTPALDGPDVRTIVLFSSTELPAPLATAPWESGW